MYIFVCFREFLLRLPDSFSWLTSPSKIGLNLKEGGRGSHLKGRQKNGGVPSPETESVQQVFLT